MVTPPRQVQQLHLALALRQGVVVGASCLSNPNPSPNPNPNRNPNPNPNPSPSPNPIPNQGASCLSLVPRSKRDPTRWGAEACSLPNPYPPAPNP